MGETKRCEEGYPIAHRVSITGRHATRARLMEIHTAFPTTPMQAIIGPAIAEDVHLEWAKCPEVGVCGLKWSLEGFPVKCRERSGP